MCNSDGYHVVRKKGLPSAQASNVPFRSERKGRRPLPPRAAGRNVASETKEAVCLRLALRVCRVLDGHQDIQLWVVVREMLPKGSYQGECRVRVAD